MSIPQSGIFVEGTTAHRIQEYDVAAEADAPTIQHGLAEALATITDSEADQGHIVVGFGHTLAERLDLETPIGFRSFRTLGNEPRTARATQHDLSVWIHGHDQGDVFDSALALRRTLTRVGEIVGDTTAFVYHDNRDLTGFIDGTENPTADEGRQLAVINQGQPGEGGSVLLVQRWVHDLDTFHALPVSEQERIIGRTKADSVELAENELPADAHIARVVMEDGQGNEIEIYRRSVPYGDSTESGLMFLGFTDELDKIDNMLKNMFDNSDGPHDRLIEFSTAQSSSYYFTPSQDILTNLTRHR
ncbi:MAG: Dyp-type peroxidase [Actinomycetia bacterium]|nr:Dyp-type peroxidase [Actinomycetes bacterium]MCP4226360.1 Dyp-type peroxidase [Actinomycetes bacterium]MCP5030989.1 Dyp-type peroxidase [Actinomycetes bacterium]